MIQNHTTLSSEGRALQKRIVEAQEQIEKWRNQENAAVKVHVAGVGRTISTAYEQLRNAAEYTEEHLLLQRTIRRFYKRNISFFEKRATKDIGEELVIELTQSGYLKNDTVPKHYIEEIEALTSSYYEIYWQLRQYRVPVDRASEWILDILSVGSEAIFHKSESLFTSVFSEFSYEHYFQTFQKGNPLSGVDYEIALMTAVHRSLLKSDSAVVRSALMQRHAGFASIQDFIGFQKQVDTVFRAKSTEKLVRLVSKNGAPLRILKRLIDEYPELVVQLDDRVSFLSAYESQTEKEYTSVAAKINRGVVKSIIFLFITKVIIGLSIEVPYDYYILGAIVWLPLIINLLFPPLFMAVLKLGMKLPGYANTSALKEYADDLFYTDSERRYLISSRISSKGSALLNIMYGAMFLFVFSAVTLQLVAWEFKWLHILIFFTFLSTASFLGFRLSRLIRELEMVSTNQGGVAVIRDFFYMPFILVGRWISDKYSRINIVALVLDMAIELPLKTFLRLLRQWTQFLNDKKDEL